MQAMDMNWFGMINNVSSVMAILILVLALVAVLLWPPSTGKVVVAFYLLLGLAVRAFYLLFPFLNLEVVPAILQWFSVGTRLALPLILLIAVITLRPALRTAGESYPEY